MAAGYRRRHQVGNADEAGDEGGGRAVVDLLRLRHLLDPAAVHHRDPVAHRQRLLLVVGDVDEGDADVALDPLQLDLQFLAQLQVQRSERLVEEEDLRQVDERPGEGDALLHPARELRRAPVALGGEPDALELGLDPLLDLGLVHLLALQPEGDVVPDAEVGEERVALEDGVGRPFVRRQLRNVLVLDPDFAAGRPLEAGDHPQRRRLAAAARTQQGEELPLRQLQVDVVDRGKLVEALGHASQLDARGLSVGIHQCSNSPPVVRSLYPPQRVTTSDRKPRWRAAQGANVLKAQELLVQHV